MLRGKIVGSAAEDDARESGFAAVLRLNRRFAG
jgi:hypothetical protein